MSSVGEFVKSKMHNMAVWVQEELGSVIAIDYVAAVDARSELELTTLCVMLHTERDIATRRDWDCDWTTGTTWLGFRCTTNSFGQTNRTMNLRLRRV